MKSFLFFGYPSGKEFFKTSINLPEKFSGSFSIFAILRATLDSLPKCFISAELKSKFLPSMFTVFNLDLKSLIFTGFV